MIVGDWGLIPGLKDAQCRDRRQDRCQNLIQMNLLLYKTVLLCECTVVMFVLAVLSGCRHPVAYSCTEVQTTLSDSNYQPTGSSRKETTSFMVRTESKTPYITETRCAESRSAQNEGERLYSTISNRTVELIREKMFAEARMSCEELLLLQPGKTNEVAALMRYLNEEVDRWWKEEIYDDLHRYREKRKGR